MSLPPDHGPVESASFAACLATILELPLDALPRPQPEEGPAIGWTTSRWLGGLGLAIAPVAEPRTFSWPGPWIARARPPDATQRRCVVMFGVPSGVVWDPVLAHGDHVGAAVVPIENEWIEGGFVVAAADIALARPVLASAPTGTGTVEGIFVSDSAGEAMTALPRARALANRGLEGDRHLTGRGTFPSGLPGSALTLIAAEVCESFDPPLAPAEHRRNLVTRGIELNALVGVEFTIGGARCRGMRLCEPCTVVERYASRPVLRALVHRGGLRADIVEDGELAVGDLIRALPSQA
ncbi:MAG: MOSC domain-containing protein [Solirubrobacteraceae bacterium]